MRNLYRGVVFAVVTTVVLVTFYLWESSLPRDGTVYPGTNFVGSTWYGPIMVLLIPLSLGWWALGAKRLYARILGLCLTLLVLAFCVLLIIAAVESGRPWLLPHWFLRWWPLSGDGMK